MAGDGSADQDIFRLWLDGSRAILGGAETGPLAERCQALFEAWGRFARAYAEASGKALGASPGGPLDPDLWIAAGGFGDLWRWFAGPGGTDPLAAERDLLRGSAQGLAYADALQRYNTVMGAAWLSAYRRFAEVLATAQKDGAGVPGWDVVARAWREAADAELAAAQCSEAFLAAQRDLIRARLDFAALLRDRVEAAAEALGLPTRAEMDELHRAVHALRREVRALRGRLDAGG